LAFARVEEFLASRFLITGGAGFLGNRLAPVLARRGPVTVFDIVEDLPEASHVPEVSFVKGDLLSAGTFVGTLRRVRPSAVVHLAAITGISRCAQSPDESFRANVHGTYNVTKAIADSGIRTRLLFASSREVYGETRGNSTAEEDPCVPNNLYGLTKLLGEHIVKWGASASNMCFTVLRFTNLYGPGTEKYGTSVFIRKALTAEDIEIMGGDQLLNMLHVDDAVRAIELCLSAHAAEGETFNIGSNDTLSVNDLIKKILEITGAKVRLRQVSKRSTETCRFVPNLAKSRSVLGFEASIGLDEGIRRTVEYWNRKLVHRSIGDGVGD
jgi:UDP-glucose 4-epimerase